MSNNNQTREIVILESPYAGDVERNTQYARRALKDSINRGEAPMASHLLYTQVLDDNKPEEREVGIDCGLSWLGVASKAVVYDDYGVSKGMAFGILVADDRGLNVEFRQIGKNNVESYD